MLRDLLGLIAQKVKSFGSKDSTSEGIKMEELTSEKKTTEENLASAKDEIANLKKNLKNMESELQKKEKIGSDLMVELDEAKRLIVLNHRKALKRPNIK